MGYQYISREEGIALRDRQARKYLSTSVEEFVRHYRAGELADCDHSDVLLVSMLISFAEQ